MVNIVLSLLISVTWLAGVSDRVYETLSTNTLESTNELIEVLSKKKQTSQVTAYLGTLKMQKAGLISGAKSKLDKFKEGNSLLENEITNHPGNVEYRFLRITIQENSPKILKYYKEIDGDAKMIKQGYSALPSELKACIKSYAKNSEALDSKDFQ